MTEMSDSSTDSSSTDENGQCFFCPRLMSRPLTYSWCVCPSRGLYKILVCTRCARSGQTCRCGRRIEREDVRTKSLQKLFEQGIKPVIGTDIARAHALLVFLDRDFTFRYTLYRSKRRAQARLRSCVGIVFEFCSRQDRLAGEVEGTASGDFDGLRPFTWRSAWAVSMIRWKCGPLNRVQLRLDAGRIFQRLMHRGIMPGKPADHLGALRIETAREAELKAAKYLLVTSEGLPGFRAKTWC